MAANYSDIQKALVAAYLSADNTTPTAFPNSELSDTQKTGLWANFHNVRAESSPITLGDKGRDNHPGFLQIDLNYPRNKGDGPLLQKADELLSFFTAGKAFTYNAQKVTVRSTSLSPGRNVGGFYRVSVTVVYYARTERNS